MNSNYENSIRYFARTNARQPYRTFGIKGKVVSARLVSRLDTLKEERHRHMEYLT